MSVLLPTGEAFPLSKAAARTLVSTFKNDMSPLINCRRCCSAIASSANFCSQCGEPLRGDREGVEAERRQLTVMFCDLVGSTTLSEKLEGEDLRELLTEYFAVVTAAISEHGGFIGQYLGDGVLAMFGWPQAREESATQAVRAGLAVLAALRGRQLQVRIGVHSGVTIIGELGTGPRRDPCAIVGETSNIAARLQTEARPGQVVISGATYCLVRDRFLLRSLGLVSLRGVFAPVRAFRVAGERQKPHRTTARFAEELTPLLGRAAELAQLEAAWEEVKRGAGRAVLVTGEAGVGKSRILRAFRDRAVHRRESWIEAYAQESTQHSPFRPLLELGRRRLGWAGQGDVAERFGRLVTLLEKLGMPGAELAPTLVTFAGGELPPGLPKPTLDPAVLRERSLATLLEIFRRQAAREPAVLVLEDLHWADASTLEFLRALLVPAPPAHLLVLATARLDYTDPWSGVRLVLSRLDAAQCETMTANLAGERVLPVGIVREIVARADGVPLYLEEITRAVLERAEVDMSGGGVAIDVPATLRDSLQARLDRLGPAREVALFASVLGREFPADLLRAAWPGSEGALNEGLERLCGARILLRLEGRYAFRHALLREAAYDRLLRGRRQRAHERVACLLDTEFKSSCEAQPELAAHHFAAAGWIERAIPCRAEAARRATARYAQVEAAAHWRHALRLIARLPPSAKRDEQELEVLIALGAAVVAVEGYGSEDLKRLHFRAQQLAETLGCTPQTVIVHSVLAAFFVARIDWGRSDEMIGWLEENGQRSGSIAVQMQASLFRGIVEFYRARSGHAASHFARSVALYEQLAEAPPFRNLDTRVAALGWGAWCELLRGNPESAHVNMQQAVCFARELKNPASYGWILTMQQTVRYGHGDAEGLLLNAGEFRAFHREHSQTQWMAIAQVLQGWALVRLGDEVEGLAMLRAALAVIRASGQQLAGSHYFGLHAEACLTVGQLDAAHEALTEARAVIELGERVFEPEILRLEARLHRQRGDCTRAAMLLRRAVAAARSGEQRWWELRAARDLAELLDLQGRSAEARAILAPIDASFSDTLDCTGPLAARRQLVEEGSLEAVGMRTLVPVSAENYR